jgi:hypothetical protein
LYEDLKIFKRRYRVMDYLQSLFGLVHSMVLTSPLSYKTGVTKSIVMADVSKRKSRTFFPFQFVLLRDDFQRYTRGQRDIE